MTKVFCKLGLCQKHVDRLKGIRNFNSGFVNGITGTGLKKDNVIKHKKSDMHSKAENIERLPSMSIRSVMKSSALGKKALSAANTEETTSVTKLWRSVNMSVKRLFSPARVCLVV